MTEFAWRQTRTQAAVTTAVLIAIVIAATLAGRQDATLRLWLGVLVVAVPCILGMFWGAPLVADELESGTFRLAWTQSVTRTRWLAVRITVGGLASMTVAGLLSLAITWWAGPQDRAGMNQFGSFDSRDIVPVGYAAFAFALGVALGVLFRRTLPAMAASLVVFVAAWLAVRNLVRPRLLPSLTMTLPLNPASTGYGSSGFLPFPTSPSSLQPAPPNIPNAWITDTQILNSGGRPLTASELAATCPGLGSGRGGGAGVGIGNHVEAPQAVGTRLHDCVARLSTTFHQVVSYQPASRYWPLQWSELAIFTAAAVVLAGLSLWWIRRIA
jgi:hypothetical protein